MNRAERSIRDALVERLYRQNMSQVEIARQVGLEPPRVHHVLQQRGLLPPAKEIPHQTTTIWDIDAPDRQRRAIWKRQRDGARRALEAKQS